MFLGPSASVRPFYWDFLFLALISILPFVLNPVFGCCVLPFTVVPGLKLGISVFLPFFSYVLFCYIRYLFDKNKTFGLMDKRAFLKGLGLTALGLPLSGYTMDNWITETLEEKDVIKDEAFWATIRKDYLLNPDFINLENGYYNIMPQPTLEKFIGHVKQVNFQGAYYMRTVQYENKKIMATKLAALTGCNPDELIMTRNTTESLDMIIGGFPWQPGDEAVMAEQDYGAMLDMFKQVSKRNGVVNKVVSVPNIPTSDEEIVNLYANAITSKTKLLMVCHMINITGQILPVRKICDMAHSKGVEVLVDGAHAIAHIQYNIPDLDCDYYGASLHKWLSCSPGSWHPYVKKDKISKIWPLIAEGPRKDDDISRLNHIGHILYIPRSLLLTRSTTIRK
jgi:hypothetical protein